jgi:phage replication O-like protein O
MPGMYAGVLGDLGMASPQVENGHIDIANELAEALAGIRISGEEYQCLWVIIRKTYGWHKKKDAIPLSQFVEMTGIKKSNAARALGRLYSKKIIVVLNIDNTPAKVYGINKDFDKWVPLSKKSTVLKKDKALVLKKDKARYSKMSTSKENSSKENYSKEKGDNISPPDQPLSKKIMPTKNRFMDFVFLSETELQKLKDRFGDRGSKERVENLNIYIGKIGEAAANRKYKSHYFTILEWEKRDAKERPGKRTTAYSETTAHNLQVVKEIMEEKGIE